VRAPKEHRAHAQERERVREDESEGGREGEREHASEGASICVKQLCVEMSAANGCACLNACECNGCAGLCVLPMRHALSLCMSLCTAYAGRCVMAVHVSVYCLAYAGRCVMPVSLPLLRPVFTSLSMLCTCAFHLPTRGPRVGARGGFSISWVGS